MFYLIQLDQTKFGLTNNILYAWPHLHIALGWQLAVFLSVAGVD